MKGKKTVTKESGFSHREGAEWLTTEICKEYRRRAMKLGAENVGAKRELQKELMDRCDITELEALNILNNCHFADYVIRYERMKNHAVIVDAIPEYLEWLAQKESEEQQNVIGDFGIEDD